MGRYEGSAVSVSETLARLESPNPVQDDLMVVMRMTSSDNFLR